MTTITCFLPRASGSESTGRIPIIVDTMVTDNVDLGSIDVCSARVTRLYLGFTSLHGIRS